MTAPDSAEATPVAPSAKASRAGSALTHDAPPVERDGLDELGMRGGEPIDARWAEDGTAATALTWVDPGEVSEATVVPSFSGAGETDASGSLLAGARLRRGGAAAGALVPIGVLVGLLGTYVGATMLWPLHELPPTVQAAEFASTAAPAADILWPAQGSAAVGVGGIDTTASSVDQAAIASVTKVVSSLMVLDRMPLQPGEQGPEFAFTRADNLAYWDYRRSDQSALDVPVGGTLTEYQLLQGTLLGSANNYIDRLTREIWGSNAAFADAAQVWLRDRGLEGITIATPSGFDARNTATPEALVALAERAMQNPVFAGIVSTVSVDLPGAGTVVNTNGMLADAGVVGVKTGTLGDSWNLLTAKDIEIDDTTVRVFAAVLGQTDDEQRLSETRALFAQVESALSAQEPAVPKGTVVGTVTTLWGTTVEIVTAQDSDVVLWNGAGAQSTPTFDLGDHREDGDEVGSLLVAGPLDSVVTPLTLDAEVAGPDPWWRLTHPFELFGLAEAQR
ncbi:D-alanyl-D-alanine carboxypeptidase family protein [Microbacterium sp. 1.5R]|uniref:D-alanyl-D-alanine carboxypeptidase family protein n=1 Tax=Microbacterium sp. 1.5R TaxID=1916917 RepID=UPI0011A80443|nr:D-alanyl-D-alanine carboxypeptidase [Microbacterium sp. 1.5R]